jgi:hypothetical protein
MSVLCHINKHKERVGSSPGLDSQYQQVRDLIINKIEEHFPFSEYLAGRTDILSGVDIIDCNMLKKVTSLLDLFSQYTKDQFYDQLTSEWYIRLWLTLSYAPYYYDNRFEISWSFNLDGPDYYLNSYEENKLKRQRSNNTDSTDDNNIAKYINQGVIESDMIDKEWNVAPKTPPTPGKEYEF